MTSGELIGIDEEGQIASVLNTYEGIKGTLRGETLSFLVVSPSAGFYLDDNGMLNGSRFNWCASFFAGRALYGPIVLSAARPSNDGDTLPPDDDDVALMMHVCQRWQSVQDNAKFIGQSLVLTADPDTIPPAQIIGFDSLEDFLRGAP